MPKPPLHTTDKRMLQLLEYCLSNGIEPSARAWCQKIEVNASSISNIRSGLQQFTAQHIENACREYNVNANYIFGYTQNILRDNKKSSPIDVIRAALAQLEMQQKEADFRLTKS